MPVSLRKTKTLSFFPMLVGLLLFTSGLMVPVTPLAYIYIHLIAGRKRFWLLAGSSLVLVALVYGLGLEWIASQMQAHPQSQWIINLPALSLLPHFSHLFVALFGIGQFAFYLAMAWIIAEILRQPKNLYVKSMRSVLALYLSVIVLAALFLIPQAQVFFKQYHDAVAEGVRLILAEMGKSSEFEGTKAIYIKMALEYWAEYSLYILPTLFLFSISFVYVLNLVIAKRVFFPFRPELLFIKLTDFRLPFYFVWLVIASLALLLFNAKFWHALAPGFLALNLLLGLLMLYFYQGLSIGVFVLDRLQLRGLWRVLLYFIFVYLFFVTSALTTLFGFFDSWLDVRRRLTPKTR